MRTARSYSCFSTSSTGSHTMHRLRVLENGVYWAPTPHMSMMPSWKPTMGPAVTTAMPLRA